MLTDTHYYIESNRISNFKHPYGKTDFMGGVCYSISHSTKRITSIITGSVMLSDKDFEYNRFSFADKFDPSSTLSINIGIGYKLF